ncbi:hypothetical protein ILUMI_05655 [Ignelater luminosus]|uniref:Uncharacterized protein n=1 Tax=Ignelater luminosus TaxID=2038154 RepID=A0A8K0D6W1_IGNLU|nr:hypothetical protein ILUMI_05655 [Ignelater luminosus]
METLSKTVEWMKSIFARFEVPEWPSDSPVWSSEALNLLLEAAAKQPQNVSLEDVLEKSESFPVPFPTEIVRCKTLRQTVSKETLERNINSAYPVLHEKALELCVNFLIHKREFGSAIEKKLYANISVLELIQRLLFKRAVVFLNAYDVYQLVDGTTGRGQWETIGTDKETSNLVLSNCLSYDELKLSALLSVSSYTHFLNDGNRHNNGITKKEGVESDGIIVGLIGTCPKRNFMEYQEMVITKDQNHEGNGYGTQSVPTMRSLVSDFYGEACFTYEQALECKKEEPLRLVDIKTHKGMIFDNNVFCKRINLSIDTLLLEANQRAKDRNMSAVVHVVGIGLGSWILSRHQEPLFLDTCAKRIRLLGSNNSLDHIADVIFAYFTPNSTSGGYKDGDIIPIPEHPNGGIKVHICIREPHTKLTGEFEGKLLVVSYAWNGNALPGNDFWIGALNTTGDPAAALSTQISEIHNPHINPKVCAENLRIATPNGVLSLAEYCKTAKHS